MKKTIIVRTFALFSMLALVAVLQAADSPSVDALQGKWEVKKKNDQGEKYTQVLQIKKDQLTFKILGEDNQVRFFASASVKAEKLGTFNILKLTHLKAGKSEDEAEAVDEDRTEIYQLRDDTLAMASNLDAFRENQRPMLDLYSRASN
jgi:hypothetical protein